jgi:hypothetical protein
MNLPGCWVGMDTPAAYLPPAPRAIHRSDDRELRRRLGARLAIGSEWYMAKGPRGGRVRQIVQGAGTFTSGVCPRFDSQRRSARWRLRRLRRWRRRQLPVRRQMVHDLRQHRRQLLTHDIGIEPDAGRDLFHLVAAQRLLNLLRGDRLVRAGAHPRLHDRPEAVRAFVARFMKVAPAPGK